VDVAEIQANDWNLNIRRYVDNTPPPEPEDVRAHLLGGVPKSEVVAQTPLLQKFRLDPGLIFQARDAEYYDFREEMGERAALKTAIEGDSQVQAVLAEMRARLGEWWATAQDDFARLAPEPSPSPAGGEGRGEGVKESGGAYLTLGGERLPEVRRALLDSLLARLTPLGVLDGFQVAGVFVNWWDGIKYDLKTILTNGWSPALIPDPYLIAAFFQAEADELERLAAELGEAESVLEESVAAAQELLEYEADEDETINAALMKRELAAALQEWKAQRGAQARVEQQRHAASLDAIKAAEESIRSLKRTSKEKQFELELKLVLKRFGPEEESAESRQLLRQATAELAELEAVAKPDAEQKKRMAALKRDSKTLQERIDGLERLTAEVGGVISEEDARALILRKHHDLVAEQLERYLGAEQRRLVAMFENLWGKYAVSSIQMEEERGEIFENLTVFLNNLRYL
jgi:type I restriction enzyme M protein